MRGVYKIDRRHVNSALTALCSLESVHIEDSEALFAALSHHALGMDFADALHLASSRRAERFATFDNRLRSAAKKLKIQPAVVMS